MGRFSLCMCLAAAVSVGGPLAAAERKPMPDTAREYIIWPTDGQVIAGGKFWLRMGLSGAGVAPAGVDRPFTGHHHVLIDADLPPLDEPIPNDRNHLHFGKGQTEARIELPPGRHTLQLILGDTDHVPHNPALYSKKITVIVPPSRRPAAAVAQDQPAPPAAGHDHATADAAPAAAPGGRTPAPHGAYAYIGWPTDGTVIRSTRFRVWFGLRGMGVAPADTDKPNTGHHHLLVDTAFPALDEPIPNDKNHLHFGKGQTETMLELPPGKHTLQLLLGDGHHAIHDPPVMSRKITVYVRP